MALAVQKKQAAKIFTFRWQGVNRRGGKISGELQGESIALIKAELRRQGVNPTKVVKKSTSLLEGLQNKIKPADIAVITRQVATMLSAGVPLVQTLNIIARSAEKPSLRDLVAGISADVEGGAPLSEALKKHPRHFDDLYTDLVGAGEQTGAMETIFDRIATYREKAEAIKSKIKKAMFYPTAVIAVAVIVTTILMLFVIPQFEEIFAGFGAELPAFTQVVIGMSRFMQAYWYMVFGGAGLGVYLYIQSWRRSETVRNNTDKFLIGIPIIGPILHKAAMARFARTLATTFAAGIPMIDALISAAGASGNYVYRTAILSVRHEVIAGMQMNIAMRTQTVFPDMVTQMVMIGEESGSIDGMLAKVANIYEQEVDDAVDGLTSLLEPLIMVVLGVLVGGMVVAMYLPIFKLGEVVG